MPTFATPQPISVTIEVGVGDIRINATARHDTAVEVRPSDSSKKSDVAAASETRVEFVDGRLLVAAPKNWRRYSFFNDGGSVDITIDLPTGSQVKADAAVANFGATGTLGDTRFKTATGDIRVDRVDSAQLTTATGDLVVGKIGGRANLSNGTGEIRVTEIAGRAVVKNSNGDTWIGDVTGDLRVNAANGDISIDRTESDISAKTANGTIRVGEAARGSVALETAFGNLEIGISKGAAAWLDVQTKYGEVHNSMIAADTPDPNDETLEVRARTSFGDILIRRA